MFTALVNGSNDTAEMLRGAEHDILVCFEQLPEQPPLRLFRKLFRDYYLGVYLGVSDFDYRVQEQVDCIKLREANNGKLTAAA